MFQKSVSSTIRFAAFRGKATPTSSLPATIPKQIHREWSMRDAETWAVRDYVRVKNRNGGATASSGSSTASTRRPATSAGGCRAFG